jgi:hypothetical protein
MVLQRYIADRLALTKFIKTMNLRYFCAAKGCPSKHDQHHAGFSSDDNPVSDVSASVDRDRKMHDL